MLIIRFYNNLGKNTGIKRKAIMKSFVTMELKKITSDGSKNLKAMELRIGNV